MKADLTATDLISKKDFLIAPIDIVTDKRLTSRQLKVLLVYFYLTNGFELNFKNIQRKIVAELTGYSVSRVTNVKASLEKLGWMDRKANKLNLKGN